MVEVFENPTCTNMSPNQIIMSFFIFFIVIIRISQSFSLLLPNCYNSSSDKINRPEVLIYDAADKVPNYDNNGTVVLQIPENEEATTFGWIGLECSHTKPIRWVYNLDFGSSGLGDSYSQTARVTSDFYDVSSYEFKADVELKIHRKHQTYLLMCVAFENLCERKVVQAFYEPEEERYILKSLNKTEENPTTLKDLEHSMVKNANWGQQNKISSNDSCPVKFSVVDSENSMQYLFQPWNSNIHPRTLPDRQVLENAYLLHEHLDQTCINDYCKSNDCFNATKDPSAKYWPLVFFMNDKNVSRVVHMYRTLISRNKQENNPGVLKFAWEYSDPQDFLEIDKLPDTFYMGETIGISCRVSQFLFSFGTLIGYQSNSSGLNNITFLKDVEEPADFYDVRIALGNVTFPLNSENRFIKIFCFSPVWNSSTEWVNVSRMVELIQPTLEIYPKENNVFELSLNTTFTTSCSAIGTPEPKLDLVPPEDTTRFTTTEYDTENMKEINITIYNIDESHQGIYKCIAVNPKGEKFYQFEIKVKGLNVIVDGGTSLSALTIALISVFGTISAIFLAVIFVLLVRFRMEKAEFRRLTEKAIREFFEGLDESQVPPGDNEHLYANDGVKIAPYDRKFEVSHKHWSFSGTLLGTGAFGVVQKGFVEIGSRKSVIAIKTVKSTEDIDDFRATLLELKIMSTVGHHRHIVRLIAASTDEINNRKVFIGVEFCANGSLLTYLQKRKKLFTNLVHDGLIEFKLVQNKINDEEQDNDHPEQQQEGVYMNLITSDISTIDLYKWSFQIASGMDYLESRKVLHADLAARNILLTEDLLVKISDFGLSRELFENSEYMKKTQVALPWRWMALESLRFLKFSIKSDVWSYGVVLYEVFTLGEEPYSTQIWNEEFVTALDNGMRLDQPPFCTDNVYTKVMTQCWQEEPTNRIRFADAMGFFEKAIGCLTSSPRNRDECRDFC